MAPRKSTSTAAVAVVTPKPVATQDNSAEALISQAITAGVDVGTMERLLAMRATIKAEQAREAFNAAMAKFQGEQPAIVKEKIVHDKYGKERYRFAPLDIIVKQVKTNLQENAIVEDGWVTAVCKVTHTLGHNELSSFKVPVDKDSYMSQPQKFAAALTFAKRYAFCNAFGILTGDEDTDANFEKFDKEPVADDVIPTVSYDDHEAPTAAPAEPWRKSQMVPKEAPKPQDPVLVLKDRIKTIADKTVLVGLETKEEYEEWVEALKA